MLLFIHVNGQQFVSTNSFDRLSKVTAGVGGTTYFGELRGLDESKIQASMSFNIGYEHLLTDNIGLKAQLSYYTIRAADSLSDFNDNLERNLNFKANNIEFIVQGVYHIFRHPSVGYTFRNFINPYIHLGIGVTTNNPSQELAGTSYRMRPLRIEGTQYGGLALIVPMGVGTNIFITRNLDLQLDLQYSYALSGFLDNVNGLYRDPASFTDTNGVSAITLAQLSDPRTVLNPPLPPAVVGSRRGDGSNDSYLIASIKLAYYLPKSLYGKSSIRCRVIKKTR